MPCTLRLVDAMEQKTPHDRQYFVMGKNRIIIAESFKADGKPLKTILEKVILDAGKVPENQQKH